MAPKSKVADVLRQAFEPRSEEWVSPPIPTDRVVAKKPTHKDRLEMAISELTADICAAMYVDTLPEARKLLAAMSNDAHVIGLRAVRSELEFLLTRKAQLEVKNG